MMKKDSKEVLIFTGHIEKSSNGQSDTARKLPKDLYKWMAEQGVGKDADKL